MKQIRHVVYLSMVAGLLLAAIPVEAAPVDTDIAAFAARGWLLSDNRLATTCGRQIGDVATVAGDDGSPLYHVVQIEGGGFVVLSADDELEPIVAFADAGLFPDDQTTALSVLLARDARCRRKQQADQQRVKHAVRAAAPGATGESNVDKWARLLADGAYAESAFGVVHSVRSLVTSGLDAVSDVRVAPLVSTHWGQTTDSGYSNSGSNCYNLYTPGNAPCGCGATALAQIIRYWQYPQTANADSYLCLVNGAQQTLALSGNPYRYADMIDDPAAGSSGIQRDAIGRLTADCAVALNSQFTAEWSSSFISFAHLPLLTTFKYANAMAYCEEIALDTQLRAAMLANFDAGAPVLLAITDGKNDYHAAVGDGYGYQSGTLYVHVNLGWTSTIGGDLWYNLPTITAGPNGDVSHYSIIDSIVYNIFPEDSGKDILSGRVVDSSGNPAAGKTVTAYPAGSSTPCASATTSETGIYALLLTGGKTYDIVCESARRTKIRLPASGNPGRADPLTGSYSATGMAIGNSWGNDLTLGGGGAPEQPGPVEPEPPKSELAYDFDCALDGLELTLGAEVALAVDIETIGCTVKSFRAKGLPSGLRLAFDRKSKTYAITGTAKRASSKDYTVTLTLQVKPDNSKLKAAPLVKTFTVRVPPLPEWAIGTFSGLAWIDGKACALGLSVKSSGAISGTVTIGKKRYTFSAKGYATDDDGALLVPVAPKKLGWTTNLKITSDTFGDVVAFGTMANEDGSAFAVQNIWTFKACKKLLKSYRSADRMLSWSSSGKFIYTAMAADGKKKERTSGYWLPESMEGGKMTLVGYAIGNTTATCLKAIIDTAAPADAEVEIIPLELPSNPD